MQEHLETRLSEETRPWTELRPRYVLIIRLPREVEVRIEDTYLSIPGATRPPMGYHVTLLGPYRLAGEAQSPFLPAIPWVCRRHRPIDIRLSGLGVFYGDGDNAVYLRVADTEPILTLHKDLFQSLSVDIILDSERGSSPGLQGYNPHVSLGLGLSEAEVNEFLRLALGRPLDLAFRAHSIWLAEQAPNGPWRYMAEFALGDVPYPEHSPY